MSTQIKPRILAFVDRYDSEAVQALRHAGAELAFERAVTVYMGGYPPSPILIAAGPVGGEKLCQYITDWGLDGVQCIVLVGVTAPWAESEATCRRCGECVERAEVGRRCRAHFGTTLRLPLGPLEPLREFAAMAREGKPCRSCRGKGNDGTGCKSCQFAGSFYPWKLVIACAPDDGVCAACNGYGVHNPGWPIARRCGGSGKALSSADVAGELWGFKVPNVCGTGGQRGLQILSYTTSADLVKHGLRAALELAVKE